MKFIYLPLCLFLVSATFNASALDRYAPVPGWYSDYDVTFYKIDIEADNHSIEIKGATTVVAKICTSGLKRFTLELTEGIPVDSVFFNGIKTTYTREEDLLFADSPVEMIKDETCTIKVYYSVHAGNMKGDSFFSGVSNKRDPSWDIPVTWTLSEPFNAKNWFPCKQHLPDKADSAYIFITVPGHLKAGAPGMLTAVTPVGEGRLRYEWKTFYPVAYYLLSFAVSDYEEYNIFAYPEGIGDSLLVQNYIYNKKGYLEQNKKMIDATTTMIELFSRLFTPYPYPDEKYGHCAAPMGGGMEHQTMTTISEFSFQLIAHELAHQWFGNSVTCSSFQDIWINEGFATYSEYIALQNIVSQEEADRWMKGAHTMAGWTRKGSVFIPEESANDVWRIFNMNLSYKKGAVLVHYIRYLVDDDQLFFGLLKGFLQKFAFSTASVLDFKQFAEEYTLMDFTVFFDQWIYGEGFPIFDISWMQEDGKLDLLVEQQGASPNVPLFVTDMDIQFKYYDGTDTIVRINISKEKEYYRFFVKNIAEIIVDPGYYVLKEIRSNTKVKDLPTNDQFVACDRHIKRKQDLVVNINRELDRKDHIILTDAAGDIVVTEIKPRHKKSFVLPMDHLSNGAYLLYVKNGKEQYVRKIVKSTF